MLRMSYWLALMVPLFVFSYPVSAKSTRLTFDKFLTVWSVDGSTEIDTKNCNVYSTQEQEIKKLVVNKECNILHFSMFAFYNECKQNPDQQVRIVGEGVEIDFVANKANCNKVYQEVFDNSTPQSSTENNATRTASEKKFVIQFYSGQSAPNVDSIKCKTDDVLITKMGSTYYALSKRLTKQDAQTVLRRLKTRCSAVGWVRLHPTE